jgi:hypothetical protein
MRKMMVILLMITATMAYAQNLRAVVREVRGEVEVKAPGASDWRAAAVGQHLDQETLISTGFRSAAVISLGSSTLQVQPLTRLSLAEIAAAAERDRVDIHLRAGRIRVNVKAPIAGTVEFTVRSPIATASVRGTVFEFDTINLKVDEGTVSFSGADGAAVYVMAGQSSSPDSDSGRTAAPVATSALQSPALSEAMEALTAAPAAIPGFLPVSELPVDVGIDWGDPP